MVANEKQRTWGGGLLDPRGASEMKHQGQTIDAPGIVITYSPGGKNYEGETSPHKLAEVSVRLLGALLLLYRQHAPQSSSYEVHHTAAQ